MDPSTERLVVCFWFIFLLIFLFFFFQFQSIFTQFNFQIHFKNSINTHKNLILQNTIIYFNNNIPKIINSSIINPKKFLWPKITEKLSKNSGYYNHHHHQKKIYILLPTQNSPSLLRTPPPRIYWKSILFLVSPHVVGFRAFVCSQLVISTCPIVSHS